MMWCKKPQDTERTNLKVSSRKSSNEVTQKETYVKNKETISLMVKMKQRKKEYGRASAWV